MSDKKNKKIPEKSQKSEMKKWDGYLDIPNDVSDDCKEAIEAFNFGNFKKARFLSEKLLKSDSETELNIAREILDRTGVDLPMLYIALASVIVLIFIFIWAVKISS